MKFNPYDVLSISKKVFEIKTWSNSLEVYLREIGSRMSKNECDFELASSKSTDKATFDRDFLSCMTKIFVWFPGSSDQPTQPTGRLEP